MFRITLMAVMAVFLAAPVALAQARPKGKTAVSIRHGVGDRFVTTAPIIVAVDEADSFELARSLVAGDKEGVDMMIADKTVVKLDIGVELVVLEIATIERPRRDKSSVCRVIQNGKAVGKHPVHFSWFTTGFMKKTKDVDVLE